MPPKFFAAVSLLAAAGIAVLCGTNKPANVQAEPIVVTYPEASFPVPVAAPGSIAGAAPASCPCVSCKCSPCECSDWHPGTWLVGGRLVYGQVKRYAGSVWGYSDCGKMYRIKDGAGTLYQPPVSNVARTVAGTGGGCSSGSCGSSRGLFGRR